MGPDTRFIIRTVTVTLSLVILGVVTVLLVGLFDPAVDNEAIFAIIGPAFQTTVGAFVGFLSALAIVDKRKPPGEGQE